MKSTSHANMAVCSEHEQLNLVKVMLQMLFRQHVRPITLAMRSYGLEVELRGFSWFEVAISRL